MGKGKIKIENIIFLVCGLVATIVGILLICNVLTIKGSASNGRSFGIIVLVLGVCSLILFGIDLYRFKKSIKEEHEADQIEDN